MFLMLFSFQEDKNSKTLKTLIFQQLFLAFGPKFIGVKSWIPYSQRCANKTVVIKRRKESL